jgi:cob(I)alamin adenosyltransferase
MPERELQKMDERIRGFQGYGLIQLIHGTGKGKTTAALGQVIRCAGAGKRVVIVYFDKGGESHYNERRILDTIPNIAYVATGRDRIDPVTNRFDFSINEVDKTEAQRGIIEIQKALTSGECDLVVLDEINSTVDLGMVEEQSVLDVLAKKTPQVEVILTGRNPPQSFVDLAHLVTEMKLEKHYFYSGVAARAGLDY